MKLRRPRVEVSYDPARGKGDSDLAVTIGEFSGFQCPFCRNAEAALREAAAKYGGEARQ